MKIVLAIAAVLLPLAAARVTGGVTNIPAPELDDVRISFASSEINKHFLAGDKDAAPRAAIQILKATSQTVQGTLYKFTIKMDGENGNEICDITVWARIWLQPPQNYQSKDISCKKEHLLGGDDHDLVPHGTGKPLIGGGDHDYLPHGSGALLGGDDHDYQPHGQQFGGHEEADMNDPTVQKALSAFADRVNMQINSMYRVIPTGGKVTTQVVNGLNFEFKNINMVYTTCKKSDETNGVVSVSVCPIDTNMVNTRTPSCSGKIYWNRETFEVQSIECK